MINKKIIIGIILFIVGGLIVWTFANPAPNEEPIPNNQEEPIDPDPEEPEEPIPVTPEEPVIPVVPVTPVTPTPVTPTQPVSTLADRIAAARAVVARAERTLLQADVNTARRFVAALPTGTTRTGFTVRLDAVQDQIDLANEIAAAIAAVELAETTKSQANVNTAAELTALLPAGTVKTNLTARIVAVQAEINLRDADKIQAIAMLNTHVIAKGMNNYSSTNWSLILTHQTNGVNAINAATTAAQVDTALANARANVDGVLTIVGTAKTLAVANLNNFVDDLEEEYYSVANWNMILSYQSTATVAINAATTVAQIRTLHSAVIADINEVEMRLEPTIMLVIADLNSLVNGLRQSDYTVGNWNVIKSYQNRAIAAINGATTVAQVRNIESKVTTEIEKVETVLDTTKLSTIVALKDFVDDLDSDDYYGANWTMILNYHTAGIAAINASTTVPMVGNAFALARTNIENVETKVEADLRLLAEAKVLAKNSINNFVGDLLETDYTMTNWNMIIAYRNTANTEIDEATTVAEVNEIHTEAISDIEEVESLLDVAKLMAISDLDDLFDLLDNDVHYEADCMMLKNYHKMGIEAIKAATTFQMVTNAFTVARINMENVETKAEKDARLLSEAKLSSIEAIRDLVASLIPGAYTVETWDKILEYEGEAIEEINASDTIAEVLAAEAYRTRKIEEKETILETDKAWAIEELDDVYDDLDEDDYSDANWTMIVNYRRSGISAIDAATTTSMVSSALSSARTNILSVPVGLTGDEEDAIYAVERYERKIDDDYRRDAKDAVDELSSSPLRTQLRDRIDQVETLLDEASSEVIDNFLEAVDLVEELEDYPTMANKNAARAALDVIQSYTKYNDYYIVSNLEYRFVQAVNIM